LEAKEKKRERYESPVRHVERKKFRTSIVSGSKAE